MKKEAVDNFIGRTFPTPKGGVLTVVGTLPKVPYRNVKFALTCSICSEDEELYPYKFEAIKSGLNRGEIPCGCSRHPYLSVEQYTTLINREVSTRDGIIFLGFANEFKNIKETDLLLHCIICNRIWKTTSIYNFLYNRCGCIMCIHNKKRGKSEEGIIQDFLLSGIHYKESEFVYLEGDSWLCTCPICTKDEYTNEGLCTGFFKATRKSLQRRPINCRCTKGYRFTKEQQEYRINKILSAEDYVWVGWIDGYVNVNSRFLWKCKVGHICNTRVRSEKYNCKTCFQLLSGVNGYYKERTEEKDYLYVMNLIESIKIGRTFVITRRLKEVRAEAGLESLPEVTQLFTANHQVIYDTEQEIITTLRQAGYQYNYTWTNEAFYTECKSLLQERLDYYVSIGTLTKIDYKEK